MHFLFYSIFLCLCIPGLASFINDTKIENDNNEQVSLFRPLGSFNRSSDGLLATYFISNYEATASEALADCTSMFINGRLLTIFTKEEDEYIRLRLQIEGIGSQLEYVITGGRYNGIGNRWEWTATSGPFIFTNWISNLPEESGYCMELVGELSSYGWVSIACANKHKFICQF